MRNFFFKLHKFLNIVSLFKNVEIRNSKTFSEAISSFFGNLIIEFLTTEFRLRNKNKTNLLIRLYKFFDTISKRNEVLREFFLFIIKVLKLNNYCPISFRYLLLHEF